jgi:hypothetical protein
MKPKIKILFLVILLCSFFLSTKNNNKNLKLRLKVRWQVYWKLIFVKHNCFFWKNWVLPSIFYETTSFKDAELKDYCHYFRGYSFKEKTFNEAKEFKMYLIIFSFIIVKINLGDIALEQREFKDALHYFQEIF